jgi:uncharacterized protein (TIGR00290 family)
VPKKTLLSWSSGKDSAWALHVLRRRTDLEIVGLVTTLNEVHQRVAIHGVRRELLERQAQEVELPLQLVDLPSPCSNDDYESAMRRLISEARGSGVECMAFGDLFLQDIRRYREEKMAGTGITPLFPLWGMDTRQLAGEMIGGGLRAYVSCLDPKKVPATCAGREFNDELLRNLPPDVDPCGENGEFHTFAFDGPMFARPLHIAPGEVVTRDGFVYADLMFAPNGS